MTEADELYEKHFSEGEARYSSGDFLGAVEAFQAALAVDPNKVDAWMRLGFAQYSADDIEKAEGSFKKAVELSPSVAGWGALGTVQWALGNLSDALTSAGQALQLEPTSEAALTLEGRILLSLGRPEESLEAIDRIAPEDASAMSLLVKGAALLEVDKFDEALTAIDGALSLEPDDPTATYMQGVALGTLSRYEAALAAFDRFLAAEPDDPDGWAGRAASLEGLGRYEDALEASVRATELGPNHVIAWSGKASSLSGLGRHEEALEAARRAVDLDESSAQAWRQLGHDLSQLDRQDEALEAYSRSLDLDPSSSNAWHNKGAALHNLESHQEAVPTFDRALAIDPHSPLTWLLRGNSLFATGDREEALASLRKAVYYAPDHGYSWSRFGEMYSLMGRHDAAIRCCQRACQLERNSRQSLIGLSVAFLAADRPAEALETLDRVEPGNDSLTQYNRGVALYRLHRHDDAAEAWRRAGEGPEGLREAARLHAYLRAPSGQGAWVDYWFGPASSTTRKILASVLLLLTFAFLLVPTLRNDLLPWVNPRTDWQFFIISAVVWVVLLALPTIRKVAVAGVEIEPIGKAPARVRFKSELLEVPPARLIEDVRLPPLEF